MAIKRHPALQQLSREHHHALLLCWKIKVGFSKGVNVDRIKAYTDWFCKTHLLKHFELEEKFVFPVLGPQNKLVRQALDEHRMLQALFNESKNPEEALRKIQVVLEKHIRFEERVLFNEIQSSATPEQIAMIRKVHNEEVFVDNMNDVFWQ